MVRKFASVLTLVLSLAATASAQVIIICPPGPQPVRLPRWGFVPPPNTPPAAQYILKTLDVTGSLVDQVARIQVAQTFKNTGSQTMEVSFVFPLPYDGAIERMTLMVDGKEIPARLLKADEARRVYEEIVRGNRDPALLEWIGTGMFKTSVFPVPGGAERTVTLKYSQICRKDHGITDLLLPLSAAKFTAEPPERVSVSLAIESASAIKNVYSPTHAIDISRADDRHANIKFTAAKQIPGNDFRLFYDVGKGAVGASMLSYRPTEGEDGYFLLLASPEIKAPDQARPSKTVFFVVDKSGSMQGQKIEQAKDALKYVLNNLRDGDLFNIITYDDNVTTFKPELQRFNEDTRKAALGFVQGIYAGGSTNINAALTTALEQLSDPKRPAYVIFLTDGLPTAGVVAEGQIAENAKKANRVRARIFDFGVGFDVNARLLDKLARGNFGQSEYVRPDENIEAHVSRLYNRIGAPALNNVTIAYGFDIPRAEDGAPVNRVYPKDMFDLFEGEQLVVAGRYRKSGAIKVTVSGQNGDRTEKFDFPATLTAHSSDESFAFIEKLWATRRIGEIIDDLDLKGRNEELIKELVMLSTKHGILTPYTSFLADDRTDIHAVSANMRACDEKLGRLAEVTGGGGVAQRQSKMAFQSAASAPSGGAAQYMDFDGATKQTVSIQNIANKTFYCRDKQWIDSTVTDEMKKHAIQVTQFSDAYFTLAAKNGRTMAQYMAFDEPVFLNVNGQCYRVDPK